MALRSLAAEVSMSMCLGESTRRFSRWMKEVAMRWNSAAAVWLTRARRLIVIVNDFWLSFTSLLSSSRSIDCQRIEKPARSKSSFRLKGKV